MSSLAFTWLEDGQLAASAVPYNEKEVRWLHEQGIRAIVTLTEDSIFAIALVDESLFEELNLELLHTPIPDMYPPQDISLVHRVKDFIVEKNAAGQPVLVHCYGGIGRTGTILHTYYMLNGKSLAEATKYIEAIRPLSAFAGLTQRQQDFLRDLEKKLR